MTPTDALTAIHRAQEAVSLYRERRAAQDRVRPRYGKWSDKHWRPYEQRAAVAIEKAYEAVDVEYEQNRYGGAWLLPIRDYVDAASDTLCMDLHEPAQLLLDTAERLLRERLDERRVG